MRDGRNARTLWLRDAQDGSRLVLRLWASGRELDGTPLWLGRLGSERPERLMGLITYPRSEPAAVSELARLMSALPETWTPRDTGMGWLVAARDRR